MHDSKRLLSLDVFRGITIAFMILVNNPGSWNHVYAPFLHAEWHGCTPTDWVFPFFLFIVGVSVSIALTNRKESGADYGNLYKKITKRVLIIFGIGLLLALIPKFNFSTIRIPGVLQRIALVYGFCAFIFLKTDWKKQVYVSIGLLLLYWGLMTLVPVPGYGEPNLEPTTNLGAWLDNTLLNGHLWSQSKVWDPEGLLSTMPAIVTGMIGVFTGTWLRKNKDDFQKLTGIFAFGTILIAIGLIWNEVFPINKKIWTSSYVLYSGGVALLFLGICYWLIEVLDRRKWSKPFVWFGMNSLFIYALSVLISKFMTYTKWETSSGETESLYNWIYENIFATWLSPKSASLGFALTNVFILMIVALVLYRKRVFIKV